MELNGPNSTISEELSQTGSNQACRDQACISETCVDKKTCAKVPAQGSPHDSADLNQEHQSHSHQSQQIFGRSLHLAMACINCADRLQRSKTIKANSNQLSLSESTPRQRTTEELSSTATVTDVKRICCEFRCAKAEKEGGNPATGRTKADLSSQSQFNNRSLTHMNNLMAA